MADEATEKELDQIHNMDAILPLDVNKPTEREKKNAIASLIFQLRKGME